MSKFLTKQQIIVCAVLFIICLHGVFAQWTAQDANEKWMFTVPIGWYGGSYYQIMEKVSAGEQRGESDALHIQILRTLSRDARYLDAFLFHLETSADGSHGDASFLKINTTPRTSAKDGFPPIYQLTPEVWNRYGQRLLSSTQDALDVELIRHQEDIVIQGYPVATAGFKIIRDAGRDRYEGIIIIYRQSSVTTFNLEASWHIAGLRLEEMWKMARSIRFK